MAGNTNPAQKKKKKIAGETIDLHGEPNTIAYLKYYHVKTPSDDLFI